MPMCRPAPTAGRRLRERALAWPPERVAAECGISADEVRALARDYATLAPAAIRLNYGMQRVRGGGNAVRLIALLPCLIGAWRSPAGGMLLSASGWFPRNAAALQRPDLLAGRQPRTLNMVTIGDDLQRADRRTAARRQPLRSADRSAGRLQQQSGRGGARFGAGGARLRAQPTCSPSCSSIS